MSVKLDDLDFMSIVTLIMLDDDAAALDSKKQMFSIVSLLLFMLN